MQFVLDRNGCRVYPGDYVKCAVTKYDSVRLGEQRRVQQIDEDGNIIMRSTLSPVGLSPYRPSNFTIHARYQKPHMYQEKEANVLHVAINIRERDFAQMAADINGATVVSVEPMRNAMADTSLPALKERVKARLSLYPDEKWLLMTGTTVAERSDPPVRFRPA